MNHLRLAKWTCLLAVLAGSGLALAAPEPVAAPSNYEGWKSLFLSNGLVELQVLPDLGGRIIQFQLGTKEFLWVDPLVASTERNTLQLHGRFGVFAPGRLEVVAQDARGRAVATQRLSAPVTPLAAAVVSATLKVPASATTVVLAVIGPAGRSRSEITRCSIRKL